MTTALDNLLGARTRAELSAFLERHLTDPSYGWPPRSLRLTDPGLHPEMSAETGGLNVLVLGDLGLELPIEVKGTKAVLRASLQPGSSGCELAWRLGKPQVGGFVAYAARAAVALGAHVTVCTTVPVPVPISLRQFLDKYDSHWRFVAALPGKCPVTFVFHCVDGFVVQSRPGTCPTSCAGLPRLGENEFDAILLDTASAQWRSKLTRTAQDPLRGLTRPCAVGVRGSADWSSRNARLTRNGQTWTFIRGEDARQLVYDSVICNDHTNDEVVARRLQRRLGIAKLVLLLGSEGAVLMNGLPAPQQIHTCPVDPIQPVGAGATLLSVTTLSSAAGANDLTSLGRGVSAATGFSAGLDLPASFEELDIE